MKYGTLGPEGTFSSIACKEYIKKSDEIVYYENIASTFNGINECNRIIVPIENGLDGFIGQSLDTITSLDLNIIDEIYVDVKFSLLANCKKEEISKIFVQFKAKGQCLNIISSLNKPLIITQSNMESLDLLLKSNEKVAAIVPIECYNSNYPFSLFDVTDSDNNKTRFFVLSKNKEHILNKDEVKAFICIKTIKDRPGLLYEILGYFKNKNINLNSILSRPNKKIFGKYNFYIEISLNKNEIDKINNLKDDIKIAEIIILGIYDKLD